MTFGRLVVAWIVVAAWFGIATFSTTYLVNRLAIPAEATVYAGVPTYVLKRRLLESALLTLLASLWFDSLGSGEWWLVFLLIGGLVSSPKWFPLAAERAVRISQIADTVGDLARYVIAGVLLAWRLS